MKKIDIGEIFTVNLMEQYLIKQLASSTFLTALIILAIYNFISFFDYFDDYDFFKAFAITLLSSFDSIYDMAKPIIFIGVILGLSVMTSHNELLAMRTSGLKIAQITKSICYSALLFSLVIYFFGEFLNPAGQKIINHLKETRQIKITQSGLWLKNDQGIVRIKQSINDDELREVYIYQISENKLSEIKKIHRAKLEDEKWQLSGVEHQNFVYQNSDLVEIKRTQLDNQGIETQPNKWLDENIFHQFEVKIYTVSIAELWQRISFYQQNGINSNIYWLNFYKRAFIPVDLILISLFALVLVLYLPVRSHKIGSKILIGLVIGLAIHLLSQILSQTVLIYNFNPVIANLVMVAILALIIYLSWLFYQKNT